MKNVVVVEQPFRVNAIDWTIEHPNCDAIILLDKDTDDEMYIVAYALNELGNNELKSIKCSNSNYGIFRGIDASMLNNIGGLR